MINPKRIRQLKSSAIQFGSVFYWMSRDQRANDNWALTFAYQLALQNRVPLGVFFYLSENFLEATEIPYKFMIDNLLQIKKELAKKNIPFVLLNGKKLNLINTFLKETNASVLVTDFDPLKIKQEWKNVIINTMNICAYEVDAHNIVPCWIASNKQEFAAYTIRPKIKSFLAEFLDNFPELNYYPNNTPEFINSVQKFDSSSSYATKDLSIPFWKSGEKQANIILKNFIQTKLHSYNSQRNNPNYDACSNLSPYLHFGQICSQRVVLEILKANISPHLTESFLDEIIIRKELSDNYCFYNKNYDNFEGLPKWGKETLNAHRYDQRPYLYSLEEFENGKTHDLLWNSAQKQMMITGKMHGYLRMYWAKKILEWSSTPEEAQEIAIYLNNKYELDGRDPNGYTGIAWSIGGLHDRAWQERAIFGKIRYMSLEGMKRKFDINKYISSIEKLEKEYK